MLMRVLNPGFDVLTSIWGVDKPNKRKEGVVWMLKRPLSFPGWQSTRVEEPPPPTSPIFWLTRASTLSITLQNILRFNSLHFSFPQLQPLAYKSYTLVRIRKWRILIELFLFCGNDITEMTDFTKVTPQIHYLKNTTKKKEGENL